MKTPKTYTFDFLWGSRATYLGSFVNLMKEMRNCIVLCLNLWVTIISQKGQKRTILQTDYFCLPRNPLNSANEAIEVFAYFDEDYAFVSALMASGFELLPESYSRYFKLLPCPIGTFSNYSSRGAEGCIECPPGTLKWVFTHNSSQHYWKPALNIPYSISSDERTAQ